MPENDIETLLITRTKQLQLLEGFITRLVTALKDVRATADDAQRAIIDEALRSVGPFGK